MVTSRAVVGSSAIRILGSQATAIAIITRWRIPPESWCGYSASRRCAAGMRTSSSSSIARARAAARESPRCFRSTSPIWRPTSEDGVERRHRLLEHERDLLAADPPQLASGTRSRSSPSKRALPEILAPRKAAAAATTAPSRSCRSPTRRRARAPHPRCSVERHPVDGVHGPVVGAEADGQIRDLEQRQDSATPSSGRGRRAARRRAG